MSALGFWIVTGVGVAMLLYSIVIYTHSYWRDRKLHNPRIIVLFTIIGFALISTPYWDEMGGKIPGGYGFGASREKQEREMEVFVSTSKSSVDKLPPGNPVIIIFNNFNAKLQEFHKEPDEQKRASIFPDLYDEYISTSTAVNDALKDIPKVWYSD